MLHGSCLSILIRSLQRHQRGLLRPHFVASVPHIHAAFVEVTTFSLPCSRAAQQLLRSNVLTRLTLPAVTKERAGLLFVMSNETEKREQIQHQTVACYHNKGPLLKLQNRALWSV